MKKITISGIIGWDATPAQLREDLAAANGDDVEITISSPGGFVGDGLEMFNLIRNYQGNTTARLSGYAMSMASYIPLAAKRIVAEDNAVYMIHNVRGGVWGDHNEILKYGEMTAAMSRMLARKYASHTGRDLSEIQAMMDAETFLFGQDMVDGGFVHEIVATDQDGDQQAAMDSARVAFDACMARMTADVAAIKTDLQRAASLAPLFDHSNRPAGSSDGSNHQGTPGNKKENQMDLKKLKAEHQDLVQAITDEALAGMNEKLEAARREGAEGERQRIADVNAQLIPGHEALIDKLAADGKTTGAEAAMAIVAAEKAARQAGVDQLKDEANEPAAPAAPVAPASAKAEPKTEAEIKAAWDANATMRAEFGDDFDTYAAYAKAKAAGLVKSK